MCWLLAMGFCALLCGREMSRVYSRWNTSPIIYSFAPSPTNVNTIKFPAVTICPLDPFAFGKIDVASLTDKDGKMDLFTKKSNLSEEEQHMVEALSLICPKVYTEKCFPPDQSHFDALNKVTPNFENFLDKRYTDLRNGRRYELDFSKIWTNGHFCYTLNFKHDKIFYNSSFNIPHEENKINDDNHNLNMDNEVGLSLVLRTSDGVQHVCSNAFFISIFEVCIHSPDDYPSRIFTCRQWHHIKPNADNLIYITPEISTSDPNLRDYSIKTRGCVYPEEVRLTLFKNYSRQQCLTECDIARHPDHYCGCEAPFRYLEKTTNRLNIINCSGVINNLKLQPDICDCLPTCDEIIYKSTIKTEIYNETYANQVPGQKWAILKLQFSDRVYLGIHRSEVFGFTDVLSNCGGLLGLFTGFSVITLVELIYFSTIRLCCNLRRVKSAEVEPQVDLEVEKIAGSKIEEPIHKEQDSKFNKISIIAIDTSN